jgi:enoyl-CoA hydratase
VDEILKGVSAPPGEPPLAAARGWIDEVYSASAIEEICARLAARPEPEAAKALAVIGRNSPTSLKVTLRALRKGRVFAALAPCLDMELVLVGHCLRGHDLPEGIRAAVIDKDRDPRWSPATLAEVDEALVDSYFTPGKCSI